MKKLLKSFLDKMSEFVIALFFAMCFIILVGYVVYLIVPPYYKTHNDTIHDTIKVSNIKQYCEEPFTVRTYKEEFDSLDITLVFCDSIQLFNSINYEEQLWNPKRFVLDDDGYFIWEGNKTDLFLRQKEKHPGCKFVLIGSRSGKYFMTTQMFIVW